MKLVSGEFRVSKGERVTIKITPNFGVGNQFVGALDNSATLNPFDFTVTKDIGREHFVKIVFGFIGATDGAQYEISINGNGEGNEGPFVRFVRKGSSAERGFIFPVVA